MPGKYQVKCPVCQNYFDRSVEEYVHFKNRYYHKKCFEQVDKDDVAKQKIYELMREVLGIQYSQPRISQQINQFVKKGLSVNTIYKTLLYWYKVKESSAAKANGGIGIVPYVCEEALNYYEQKDKIRLRNKNINIKEPETITVVVHPKPIGRPKRLKLFPMKE